MPPRIRNKPASDEGDASQTPLDLSLKEPTGLRGPKVEQPPLRRPTSVTAGDRENVGKKLHRLVGVNAAARKTFAPKADKIISAQSMCLEGFAERWANVIETRQLERLGGEPTPRLMTVANYPVRKTPIVNLRGDSRILSEQDSHGATCFSWLVRLRSSQIAHGIGVSPTQSTDICFTSLKASTLQKPPSMDQLPETSAQWARRSGQSAGAGQVLLRVQCHVASQPWYSDEPHLSLGSITKSPVVTAHSQQSLMNSNSRTGTLPVCLLPVFNQRQRGRESVRLESALGLRRTLKRVTWFLTASGERPKVRNRSGPS